VNARLVGAKLEGTNARLPERSLAMIEMNQDYIHGFSVAEQRRLIEQADILAPRVFAGVDYAGVGSLLEIGCGVGAELKQIARRWPGVHLTGVDLSGPHLRAATRLLASELAGCTAALVRGDALGLPFADRSFDRVITIWMLEHVPDPSAVLREALRVLRDDGLLVCTEVDNASFRFDPPQPVIANWWELFNRLQMRHGDPFVGSRLAEIAAFLGARGIRVEPVPVISSPGEPARRLQQLDYLRDLLLSGAQTMLRRGLVEHSDCAALRLAFEAVRARPGIEFGYSAVRLSCGRGV
jgi:SAM-dependent methyltransferase